MPSIDRVGETSHIFLVPVVVVAGRQNPFTCLGIYHPHPFSGVRSHTHTLTLTLTHTHVDKTVKGLSTFLAPHAGRGAGSPICSNAQDGRAAHG